MRRIVLLAGLLLLMLPAAVALAGGWVVVTLESLPEQVHAGQPLAITFMVRQHGRTPTHDVSPLLLATHGQTGRQIQVSAEPAGKKGLFVAEINLPEAGAWEWSIQVPPFNQVATFAPLTVLPAARAAGPEQSTQLRLEWQALARWGGLALLATAAALVAVDRRRGRSATAPAPGD